MGQQGQGPGPVRGQASCEVSNVESRPRGCSGWTGQAGIGSSLQPQTRGTLAAPGPSLEPRFADILFCSSDVALFLGGDGEDGETRALRSQALSRKRFSWRAGQVLRSKGAWPPARETGRRGQGGDRRDSPQLPGSSHAPSPRASAPEAGRFPLGAVRGCRRHWPGSWHKGRKGNSENGAFSRSTRCSRSMQHCGQGQ